MRNVWAQKCHPNTDIPLHPGLAQACGLNNYWPHANPLIFTASAQGFPLRIQYFMWRDRRDSTVDEHLANAWHPQTCHPSRPSKFRRACTDDSPGTAAKLKLNSCTVILQRGDRLQLCECWTRFMRQDNVFCHAVAPRSPPKDHM